MNTWITWMESRGSAAPLWFVWMFLAASLLMIWRLEALSKRGFEGTVLGTLIMPYCSGIGNLIFAFLLCRRGGPGSEVMVNALVNNVTNMTLLIGLPALIWGLPVAGGGHGRGRKATQARELNRLALLLTLTAVLFFTGAVWALGRDGRITFHDGLVLVGLFLFWQVVHVIEVLKSNVRQNRSLGWWLPVDLVLLGAGALGVYWSIEWLVNWLSRIPEGFISARNLGWLSGWLMVLPNALLSLYYGWRGRPEVVYSSQVGDGHICIPLCVGFYALFRTLEVPRTFGPGLQVLLAVTAVHMVFVTIWGRLPRWVGWGLVGAYGYFIYRGLGM